MKECEDCQIKHIARGENSKPDALSCLASIKFTAPLRLVFVETVSRPSIEGAKLVAQIVEEPSWMDPIRQYLEHGTLP